MTKTYKRILFELVAVFVSLVLVYTMVSCSEDYKEPMPGSKNVSVHLDVSADDVIDVSLSRSYAYDYYAEEGEFINSLCVFIVDSEGKIVKKFSTDDNGTSSIFTEEEQELADKGNLTNWDSELDDLDEGTYTIYAFANWETTFGTIYYLDRTTTWTAYTDEEKKADPWYKLISKSEEDTITEDDITFVTSDVCGKIDFAAGRYIPMSGKNKVTIAEGSNNVNVKLDRLVAKVQVTLQIIDTSNYYDGLELTCIQNYCDFEWTAEMVWLFPNDGVMPDDEYWWWGSYITLVEEPVVKINGDAVYIGYAYVNESDLDKAENPYCDAYQIFLGLENEEAGFGLYFEPWLKTRNIPRNTVLPLSITYSEYIGEPVANI